MEAEKVHYCRLTIIYHLRRNEKSIGSKTVVVISPQLRPHANETEGEVGEENTVCINIPCAYVAL